MSARSLLTGPVFRICRRVPRTLYIPNRRYASEAKLPPLLDGSAAQRLLSDPHVREMFEKMQRSPGVVEAIFKIRQVMNDKGMAGLVPDPGEKPSMMAMARLVMDKDIREALATLQEEMGKADIDLTSNPELLSKIMSLYNPNRSD